MTRDSLCNHYATRNVTPSPISPSVKVHVYHSHGALRRGEGIEGLHCGLHSNYIVRRESFLATSDLHSQQQTADRKELAFNFVIEEIYQANVKPIILYDIYISCFISNISIMRLSVHSLSKRKRASVNKS